jgi:hypothetical protein
LRGFLLTLAHRTQDLFNAGTQFRALLHVPVATSYRLPRAFTCLI